MHVRHGSTVTTCFERRMDMDWEVPSFVEVKMDAEINSYQEDLTDTPVITEPSLEDPVVVTTRQ
jgi:hypothetical protein